MFEYKEVNDYVLLKLLGKGSFGEVHLAESFDKSQCALKVIPVTEKDKEEAKEEARMYVSFKHPNIVNAQEFFLFSKGKYLIIVLEYCPDGNLLNLIGKIDHDRCKEIMKQVAEGLVYLHEEKKTQHRDIKPENILMQNGVPKIADLGIAKVINTEGLSTKICTIEYAAPEFLNEEKYSFPADIWSLGTVFLELLLGKTITNLVAGKLPAGFRPDHPSEQLLNQIKDADLRELVQRMLDKNPKTRLTSKQVLEWLKGKNIQVELKRVRIDEKEKQVMREGRERKKIGELKNVKIDERKEFSTINQKQLIELLQENVLFPNLIHFKFYGCKLTAESMLTLSKIPSIQDKFPKLQSIDLGNNQITDVGLKALAGAAEYLENLQAIALSNNQITDVGLKALAGAAEHLKNLRVIDLSNNQITDVGLKALAGTAEHLKNLRVIGLNNNQITDMGLKALAGAAEHLENLQAIALNNNQITDVGLKALAGAAEHLKNLQNIYLSNNQITDVGLKALARVAEHLENLQAIALSNNQITDVGLKALAGAAEYLKNLQVIYLKSSKVTAKEITGVKTTYKIKFEIQI